MSKIVRLTESDLIRLVKRVINEQNIKTLEDVFNDLRLDKMGFKYNAHETFGAPTIYKGEYPDNNGVSIQVYQNTLQVLVNKNGKIIINKKYPISGNNIPDNLIKNVKIDLGNWINWNPPNTPPGPEGRSEKKQTKSSDGY